MTARSTERSTAPAGTPAGLRAASNGHGKPLPDLDLDLDAFCAEAQHKTFIFTLGGRTFTLPHIGDMDWKDTRADGDGSSVHHLFLAALGDQYDDFRALPLSSDGYNELQRRWFDHSGITLPESPASPG